MYFQEKDGYTERWKFIDFDTACFAGSSDYVKIITNYSAPEVIKAYDEGIKIRADFAMDIFSFGLILYFLETGIFLYFYFYFFFLDYSKFIERSGKFLFFAYS